MGARGALLVLALAHHLVHTRLADTVGIEDSLLDGMSIVSYQPLSDVSGGEYINSHVVVSGSENYALSFSPPQLTFGARPLGVPHIERVTITNKLNRTVHLTSISGHTMHFHSSFFEDKVVPPNGNTSFNVVFLGRAEGPVDTCLFIHTSEGIHKYMMSGTSTPSAYRLQPLMRIFLPHNASYSSLIYMHNPHDHPIQITEVYSSGGNVLLELPGGGLEGPQTLWLLPPHTTRPIIAVRYSPPPAPPIVPHQLPVHEKESPNHHVAYVRIKLHGTASVLSSVLVVAVEVITSTESGPYALPQFLDFGLGGTRDPPKKLRLFMGNSSPKPIKISSITVDDSDGNTGSGVRVLTTAKMLLPPFSAPDIHVATINLHWKQAFDSGQCCGKIIVTTKQDHRIEIPYSSGPLNGGLIMNDDSVTRYLSSESGITTVRQVLLKNVFKVGVYATELILGKGIDKYFEISAFYPQDFKVNTIQHGFRIQLKSWTRSLKFESKITLVTNISSQVIPVYIYNGRLDVVMSVPPRPMNKGVLDLGLVGVSSTTRATIVVRNFNPVPICIRGSGSNLPGTAVQLLGCSAQSPSALELGGGTIANITACTCIPAKWCALFVISIVAPATPASMGGEFWLATVHERLIVPMGLTAASGGRLSQLEPSRFENCFPGTVCSLQLKIRSTFPVDMNVVSLEAVPFDRRLFYKGTNEVKKNSASNKKAASPTIFASSLSKIGRLFYDPYLMCDGRCYTGLDLNTTVGQHWMSRITLPIDTLELDLRLMNCRYNLFLNLTSLSFYTNLSVRLDTTQVRNHMLSVSVPFVWPLLHKGSSTLLAPLAQVGRPAYFNFHLVNPSQTRPIVVQLILDWMLNEDDSSKLFPNKLKPPECPNKEWCALSSEKAFYFPHVRNTDSNKDVNSECDKSKGICNSKKNGFNTQHNDELYQLPTHLLPQSDSRLFIIPPGGDKNITIAFLTMHPKKVSSVLYIRNNLTMIEALRLNGEGVVASLKFGNRKPGSSTPLFFDITEKHLKDCDRDKNKKVTAPPNFTVKRTFVARNTGVIPVKITRFFINNIECEGYGFRVLNCEPFELLPNSTHKVDIAFTPDFTLTKVQRLLILETSLNEYVNYTLVSSIPATLASKCAAILRRPTWEITLHNVTSTLLIGIGFCVLFLGCYESYKILTFMSVSCVRDPNIVHTPFDLRAIGRMDTSKKSETWDCCPHSTENKSKESSNYKVSNWNFTDNVYSDESKTNNQSNKYEDVNQNTNIRNRKKLNKRNSNASDTTSELNIIDQELPVKDKKIVKEPVTNNTWKNFTRNSMANTMKNTQKVTPQSNSNSNDMSEQQKPQVVNSTETVNVEKQVKSQEVPKKVSNATFNATNETPDLNNQTNYTNHKKHNKSKCVSPQSHSYEEDTSSTTTESSNSGDADKENDNSTSSSNKSVASSNNKKTGNTPNNKKGKCAVQKDSYEGDGEDDEYDNKSQNHRNPTHAEVNPRWNKNKEHSSSHSHNAKSNSETEKQKTFEYNKNSSHSSYEHSNLTKTNKKEISKSNQKRDRQTLSKKRSLDKSFVFISKSENTNNLHTTNSFSIARSSPSTPPAISTVWENRASFSDVVARSEHSFSTNFVNHPKETPDSRKSEPKPPVSHGSNNQSHNVIKYSTDENRKIEPPIKQNSDLGPIGSNYYSKKPSWSESPAESQPKQFVSSVQMNSHPQSIPEDIHSMNNNSYFLSSTYYKNIADLTPKNINVSHHGNTTPVNYGSIGSSINNTIGASMNNTIGSSINNTIGASMNNTIGSSINNTIGSSITNTIGSSITNTIGNNNMSKMQFNMGNSPPVMQNLNENNMNMQSNPLNLNSYEPCVNHNNYGIRLSPVGACNTLDYSSSSDLLDLATGNNMSMLNSGSPQITSMDNYDQLNPWVQVPNEQMNMMGHNNMSNMNEDMYDIDYKNSITFNDDEAMCWSADNLWDPSPMSSPIPNNNTQNNSMMMSNAQIQISNNENTISTCDRDAAEWLWGYNNNATNTSSSNVHSQIQNNTLPSQSNYNMQFSQQPPQIPQQENMYPYDPYRSLNSIWSCSSSMDLWTNNQNYDGNNPDLNGHGHTGHYQ